MAAALRRLLRQRTGAIPVASPAILFLAGCCSTSPTQPAAASSEEHCYVLGAFGKMQFSRQQFIPIDKYMKENENSILQPVPKDRLILSVRQNCNYFTSEHAKQFIRSGYLAAHFAKTLNLSISGAFADGNVGVISGLNILAFLKLDTDLSGVPDPYPLTYVGFSEFLQAKMKEIYSEPKEKRMSDGLRKLIELTYRHNVPDYMIIYHPEFLSLEAIASLYIEAFRILRRQMPSTGEDVKANNIIMYLHALLGKLYFETCFSDPIMSGWRGESGKPTGLLGAFDLPAPPGAQLNLTRLNSSQRRKMKKLTMIAYGIAPSTESKKQPPPPVYPRDPQILLNPKQAVVLDTHRHCMVHLVEDETVYRFFQELPEANQTSLRNKVGMEFTCCYITSESTLTMLQRRLASLGNGICWICHQDAPFLRFSLPRRSDMLMCRGGYVYAQC